MRLVLIGDIHHYRRWVAPWSLFSKRFLGQTHLWLRRQFHFDRNLTAPILRRAASLQPDLMLFTGDLTTTAYDPEFADIRRFLDEHAPRRDMLIIPGNHDRYTFRATKTRALERHLGAAVPDSFPHHRQLTDRWHLYALDGGQPQLFSARGRLGEPQLQRLSELFAQLPPGSGAVVMCHYHLALPDNARNRPGHLMTDADQLQSLLRSIHGRARVLYLHGHIHRPWVMPLPGAELNHVTDICAGAPTAPRRDFPHGQGFFEIDLPHDPAGDIHLTHHFPSHDLTPDSSNDAWTSVRYNPADR